MTDKIFILDNFRPKVNEVEPVSFDRDGVPLYRFNYSYIHEGRTLTMDFTARDFNDAKMLCENIKTSLKLEGQVISEGYI